MFFHFLFYQFFIIFYYFLFNKNSGWCNDYLHYRSVKVPVAIHSITQGKGVMIISAHAHDSRVVANLCLNDNVYSLYYALVVIGFYFPFFSVFGIEILKKCDQNSWLECGIWLAKGIRETRQPKPVCHYAAHQKNVCTRVSNICISCPPTVIAITTSHMLICVSYLRLIFIWIFF